MTNNEQRSEKKNVIALIPAYEPDRKLLDLLKDIKQRTRMSIVLVNDGSSLKKNEIFEEAIQYAKVVRHSCNRGKGAALKTGLRYILENYPQDSIIVTLDADGQHRLEDAVKLVRALESDETALVLGVREFTGRVPLSSRIGNRFTKGVFHIVTGREVQDTQTGLRAFSSLMIPYMLEIEGEHYEYEMNVLLNCSQMNIPIKEIKIETIYQEGNASSHFNVWKDSFRIYGTIFKFIASSFLCFLFDYALYSILMLLSHRLWFSNVCARIVSATANFYLNKRFVFRDEQKIWKPAVEYALTALVVLLVNTMVLTILVDKLIKNAWVAKLIVEMIMFIFSWAMQQFVIFNKAFQGRKKEK